MGACFWTRDIAWCIHDAMVCTFHHKRGKGEGDWQANCCKYVLLQRLLAHGSEGLFLDSTRFSFLVHELSEKKKATRRRMCVREKENNFFKGAVGGPLRLKESVRFAQTFQDKLRHGCTASCKTILIAIHPTCYLLAINNCFAFMMNSPAANLPIQ